MAEVILFVFEGEKTEVQLSDSLLPHFIADGENTIVRTAYRNHIYSLIVTGKQIGRAHV